MPRCLFSRVREKVVTLVGYSPVGKANAKSTSLRLGCQGQSGLAGCDKPPFGGAAQAK